MPKIENFYAFNAYIKRSLHNEKLNFFRKETGFQMMKIQKFLVLIN